MRIVSLLRKLRDLLRLWLLLASAVQYLFDTCGDRKTMIRQSCDWQSRERTSEIFADIFLIFLDLLVVLVELLDGIERLFERLDELGGTLGSLPEQALHGRVESLQILDALRTSLQKQVDAKDDRSGDRFMRRFY